MSKTDFVQSTWAGFHGNQAMYPSKSSSSPCAKQILCKPHGLDFIFEGYMAWFPRKPAHVVSMICAGHMGWNWSMSEIGGPGFRLGPVSTETRPNVANSDKRHSPASTQTGFWFRLPLKRDSSWPGFHGNPAKIGLELRFPAFPALA